MKKLFIYLALVYGISMAKAQNIRKNYNEMTSSEISDYNAAIQIFWNGGSTSVNNHNWFALMHNTHFNTNIHSVGGGQNFTSFHRLFMLHWELLLKNTNPAYEYLNIAYWDWREDPTKNGLPTNSTNFPNFWAYSFLPIGNFTSWGTLSRPTSFPSGNSLPSFTSYNTALAQSVFLPNFSSDLESNNHNGPHVWTGGTMGGGFSPRDPIFFSHHSMVDKIWQDWEDQTAGIQSVFPTSPFAVPIYRTADAWIDNLDANSCADSRTIPFRYTNVNPLVNYDVWYAQHGKVVLDGANNADFVVNGNGKIYRYTTTGSPLGGQMCIGDLYRDASDNILPDNKGGFTVQAGTSAHFRAGAEIQLMPGSSFIAGGISEVSFKIITTPNGF